MQLEYVDFTYDFFKQIAGPFIENNVTDFHIAPGTAPYVRRSKSITELRIPARDDNEAPVYLPVKPMSSQDTKKFAEDLLYDAHPERDVAEKFIREIEEREVDTTLSIPNVSRFRVHISKQRSSFTCSIRVVPNRIPSIAGFPPEIKGFTQLKNGLIVVSGKAGAGKTTTLAMIIDEINKTQQRKIITLEDPIEYLHKHDHSMIIQREIGTDTSSYKTGLLSALREDPDVIVIGELRDVDSFEIALNAAESGCLVMTTMHSADAAETLERIVSMFSDDKQNQVKSQLATVVKAIICQQLIPCIDKDYGSPLVCAFEIMTNNSAISTLIRKGEFKNVHNVMQSRAGNRLMAVSLQQLRDEGLISEEEWFNRHALIDQKETTR